MNLNPFVIRPCRLEDEAAAYEVCLKTGDSGADGTHLYPDHPRLLGHIYVGPYLHYEPDLAFVLEDEAGVCGYVLAALDSERFYQRYLNEWLPPLQAQYPAPAGEPSSWTPSQQLQYELHHPEPYYPETLRPYPAHVHIDLLPRAQGCGQGQRMMQWQLDQLIAKGVPGVHLGLSGINHRAHHFYLKLGFVDFARVGAVEPKTIFMTKRLP